MNRILKVKVPKFNFQTFTKSKKENSNIFKSTIKQMHLREERVEQFFHYVLKKSI